MDDLISRQAALDAIKSADNMLNSKQLALYAAMDNIRLLPSVQPERKTCKGCLHIGHGYKMPCTSCARNSFLKDWWEDSDG